MADGPLRILLVSLITDARHTGMGKWSHEIAAALQRRGHAPTLWFADRFPTVGAGRLAVLAGPVALAAALVRARRHFDAAIVHEPSGPWYGLARRLLLRKGPPLIAMCHNVERRVFRELVQFTRRGCAAVPWTSRVKAPLFRHWQSAATIRLADHVLCLSSHDVRYLTTEDGRTPDGVTRLVNGVSDRHRSVQRGMPGRRVLFVGGWVDVKGRRVLPRLWQRVRQSQPEATLTLVGTGADPAAIRAAFPPEARTSLELLPGFADEDTMLRLFAAHDVLLVPSLAEGCPLIVLEAMAAGLPVAATRVGGIPDLVRDDTDGLLFPPCDPDQGADAVASLLGDVRRAAALAANARTRARAFTWDAAAAAVERAVRQVVA